MTEPAPTPTPSQTPTPAPTPTPTPTPAPAWHDGVSADHMGFWNNKGYDLNNFKDFAIKITDSYRAAEKHIGAPADQLLRIPQANAKPEDVTAFWRRLGAVEGKDYDLSGVKFNGQDLEPAFADAMRGALAGAYVPKDRAGAIVGAVVKYLEDAEKAENVINTNKVNEQKAKLQADWGTNYDFNHRTAMLGAKRLGITPEAVEALENQIGYAAVMETMRKIGAGTTEDTFIERGATGGGMPATAAGAKARLEELSNDSAWRQRLLAGGAAERAEWDSLTKLMTPSEAA